MPFVYFVSFLLSNDTYLTVTHSKTGEKLAVFSIEDVKEFTIEYIHSVDRQPVWEQFRIDNNREIVLEKTGFKMLGAGMASFPDEGTLVYEDGWNIIKDLSRPLDVIHLRVGYTSDPAIVVNNQELKLSQFNIQGELVLIEVEEITRGNLIKEGVISLWGNQQ